METNNFITMLLEEKRSNNVDWIRVGRYIRQLQNPPKIDNELTQYFSENLTDIIQEKLKTNLMAQEVLKNLRKRRLQLIIKHIPPQYHWFYLELEAHLFKEYFVISKWNNYWLNLFDLVHKINKPVFYPSNHVSDSEIEKAKEYPIENLYEGNLRKSGNRLCGLCLFHEEKHGSFFIFENNTWFCFGACGEGGDSISLAMKLKNLNFVEAVKYLNYGHC